jgi:signal transduction histidine kinase
LITNAIKYRKINHDSYLNITATATNKSVEIIFEDNGIGIDMELHSSNIFGLFNTFHSNDDGQGIGLFISKNQIEAMRGTIIVESEINKGSTFTIHLNNDSSY